VAKSGLDPNLAEPWETTINKLLHRRNGVAHGTEKNGIEVREYRELQQAVTLVVDGLVTVAVRTSGAASSPAPPAPGSRPRRT
jgi:hypothetical protein